MTPRWPVVADLGDLPALTAEWRPFSAEFPPTTDPALAGHDPLAVTAADAGLADDPIAVVLELRARLEAAIEQLTPAQRAELVQYGWPAAPGLKAVA